MLYISRIRNIATEVFKALNELSLKYLQDMIEKRDCDYNLHASSHLIQPKCNTMSYGLNSFRYKGQKHGTLFQTISKKLSLFQNLNFYLNLGMGPNVFVISARLCWKPMWTTDKDESAVAFMTSSLDRPHDTIHPPFWGLAGITGANGSSWN